MTRRFITHAVCRYTLLLALTGLVSAGTCSAAALTIAIVITSEDPGITFLVSLSQEADLLTGLQFDLEYDADVLDVTVEAGTAAKDSGKTLQTSRPDGAKIIRVLVIGFNRNNITDGIVATVHVAKKPGVATSDQRLRMTAAAGTTGEGKPVAIQVRDEGLRRLRVPGERKRPE